MSTSHGSHRPGSLIGRYRVIEAITEGSAAAVYHCEDPLLGRQVALLVLAAPTADEPTTDGDAMARHERGLRLLARFRHPHIVNIFDAGIWQGAPYQVLELVDGRGLSEFILPGQGLEPLVALRIAASIAAALQYVHGHGVAHGDVKPANIIIRSTGEPVLVDFGLAAPLSSAAADGGPEPLQLDLWGLGATLFCALAGVAWLPGTSVAAMRDELASRWSELPPRLPEYVVALLRRSLARDRGQSYGDADELKRALEIAAETLDHETAITAVRAPLTGGRTVLLHVEYREAELPGSYREYQIEEQVSEGAFGDVYRAQDLLARTTVALKVLKPRWLADPAAVERFRREALILTRLLHPNIVRIHNFGRYGQSFFIAMEYLRGPTLQAFMNEHGPLGPAMAATMVAQILEGLAVVAQAGVVHRDLKPANVKVIDERAVLFDFGVSRAADMAPMTRTGSFVGTIPYASPEQLRGHAIGSASDVYSAAVILYRMLAGRLPHEADDDAALMMSIATQEPTPLRVYRPDLPSSLIETVHHMLARDPAERPDAASAASTLRRFV